MIVGISEVDTRAVTRKLRDVGCLNGVISTDAGKSDAKQKPEQNIAPADPAPR